MYPLYIVSTIDSNSYEKVVLVVESILVTGYIIGLEKEKIIVLDIVKYT